MYDMASLQKGLILINIAQKSSSPQTFSILQKPSLKSPPSVLSQGATMSNFQAKYSLSAGF